MQISHAHCKQVGENQSREDGGEAWNDHVIESNISLTNGLIEYDIMKSIAGMLLKSRLNESRWRATENRFGLFFN